MRNVILISSDSTVHSVVWTCIHEQDPDYVFPS